MSEFDRATALQVAEFDAAAKVSTTLLQTMLRVDSGLLDEGREDDLWEAISSANALGASGALDLFEALQEVRKQRHQERKASKVPKPKRSIADMKADAKHRSKETEY